LFFGTGCGASSSPADDFAEPSRFGKSYSTTIGTTGFLDFFCCAAAASSQGGKRLTESMLINQSAVGARSSRAGYGAARSHASKLA
jgi:hypothetical protein